MHNYKNSKITEHALMAEYSAVYRYILTLCKNETEAYDLTQETFYKAIKSASTFKERSGLYTWLCAIAKNLWLNKLRKKHREELESEIIADDALKEKTVEQKMVDMDFSKKMHMILHKMNEPYKEVFSLRVFGELPFLEIAELFSKTESWARVTYHRAKKMMIEELKKDGWVE